MSADDPFRYGFIRGLATLPLVGGSLSVVGRPKAVDVPVMPRLLTNYETFLIQEARRLSLEVRGDTETGRPDTGCPAWFWSATAGNFHDPSTRAALVMTAVGLGWREGPTWP